MTKTVLINVRLTHTKTHTHTHYLSIYLSIYIYIHTYTTDTETPCLIVAINDLNFWAINNWPLVFRGFDFGV